MMDEKQNMNSTTAKKVCAQGPMCVSKAACVIWMPFKSGLCGICDSSTINAVAEHTIIVSTNTPSI